LQTALNLRIFLIILYLPAIYELKNTPILHKLLYKALSLDDKVVNTFTQWVADYKSEFFLFMVKRLQEQITSLVIYLHYLLYYQ